MTHCDGSSQKIIRKEVKRMSEKEKNILETIAAAIPKMSDFDKGYLLGKAEGAVSARKNKERKDKEPDQTEDTD